MSAFHRPFTTSVTPRRAARCFHHRKNSGVIRYREESDIQLNGTAVAGRSRH
jgi:hypothetical protein